MATYQSDHIFPDDSVTETMASPDDPQFQDKEKQEESKAEVPPRETSGWRWAVASIAILSSIFLYALDATVVAVIQARIVQEFDALDDLAWVSAGFVTSATATNMVWGQIYSQFNSKWLYIFNVVLFEIGSAICGAAPGINAMIVGRVICGVGGSGLYVGVMTLISVTTTMAERPIYVSGTGLTWGMGIVLGPVVGGAFQESSVGWRWAFYINLFIGAVCGPAYVFLLPSKDPRPGVPYGKRAQELDYAGIVLLMACLVTFIMAINWGGVTYLWNSGQVIGLFAAAGVLFILLGIQQVWTIFTTSSRRLLPVQFFRSRTVLLLFATTGASASAAFITIYFVPLFFQFARGDGALDAGVRLLPLIIVMVVTISINGAMMAKFGFYMPWYTVGGLLCVTGGALMYTVEQGTSEGHIYGYTVLIGTGVGMWIQASFSVAQAVVDPENVAQAIGFITLAQFLGLNISLAIANSVFLNESEKKILEILPNASASEIQAAIEGATGGFLQNLSPVLRTQVVDAIVSSIDKTYILVMTSGALVATLSLFMKREKLFITTAVAGA